jgi:hypothetical protein
MSETSSTIAQGAFGASIASIFARRLVRYLVALALFLLTTCVYFAPLIFHLDSRALVGFSDATSQIRDYDVMDAAGANPFTFRHDALDGAPEGVPTLPQPAIAQPVQHSVVWMLRYVVDTAAALNLFLLAGFVLTGFAGFALLDWARFGMVPSLFGGFVMAFNPWMVERAISGHVAFIHGWTLILLLAVLAKLRVARTLRWAALAGLAYGLCFLLAAYMGLLATALVIAFAVVDFVSQKSGSQRLWTCNLLVVIGGVVLLALLPGLVAYATDHRAVSLGLKHGSGASQSGGARPDDYLIPVARHPVLGVVAHLRTTTPFSAFHEQDLFVGYTVLALASLAAVRLVRGRIKLPTGIARSLVDLSAVAIPIAFIASMQRKLPVLGLDVPMPSYLIGNVTTFFRIFARLGYVVEIGLAVLAAAALYQIIGYSGRRIALSVMLVSVAVFEFLPGTLSSISIGEPPRYDAWLALQPKGIAAHYPALTDTNQSALLAGSEVYYQRFTLQPLYELTSPARPGTREDAIRVLSRHVDARGALGVLAAERVRYVVIHDDVYRAQGEAPPRLKKGARLLRTFGAVRVYRVVAKPVNLSRYLEQQSATIARQLGLAPRSVSFAGGFYRPETYLDYRTSFRWMSQSGEVDIENTVQYPVRIWLEGAGFSNGVTRRIDLIDSAGRAVASLGVPTNLGDIRLGPIELPPGTSRFTLEASPGPMPLGSSDSRVASVFLSDLRSSLPEPVVYRSLRE